MTDGSKKDISNRIKKLLYDNRDCPDKVNVHTLKNHLKIIIQVEYFITKKKTRPYIRILKNGNKQELNFFCKGSCQFR